MPSRASISANAKSIAVPGPRELYEETIPNVLLSDVPIEAIERLEADAVDFPGAVAKEDYRRSYPLRSTAAHAVGYLGRAQPPQRGEVPEDPTVRPGERIGVAGAEKQFDPLLRGVPGIEILRLTELDIVRHRLVQEVVARYGNGAWRAVDAPVRTDKNKSDARPTSDPAAE